jgi:nucleoside-diphosphate kinase
MEKTLLIFKPDSFENKCVGEVLQHFEGNGFELCACKMTELSSDLLRDHYAHLIDLPHFSRIVGFMSKRPVIIIVLQTENAVKKARDLIGPTDSKKAEKGTIRGDFGTDLMRNVVHASDSVENAKLEIKRFFSSDEVYDL